MDKQTEKQKENIMQFAREEHAAGHITDYELLRVAVLVETGTVRARSQALDFLLLQCAPRSCWN